MNLDTFVLPVKFDIGFGADVTSCGFGNGLIPGDVFSVPEVVITLPSPWTQEYASGRKSRC